MKTSDLLTTLRRQASVVLLKKLEQDLSLEERSNIHIILKQRGVEIPEKDSLKTQSFVKKLDKLICDVCESSDAKFKMKVGALLPETDISECSEEEAEALIKKIEDIHPHKKTKEKSKNMKREKETLRKKGPSKKEIILNLIKEGKSRKEISSMKIVSNTYLSKFYAD